MDELEVSWDDSKFVKLSIRSAIRKVTTKT